MSKANTIEVLSGGSGGLPKAIYRSAASWEASADLEQPLWGLSKEDRFLVLADPGHSLWPYVFFRAHYLTKREGSCQGLGLADLHGVGAITRLERALEISSVVYAVPALMQLLVRALQRPISTPSHDYPNLPTLPASPCPPPSFKNVRRILLGGSQSNLKAAEILACFPSAQVHRFYGTAECSFIGHGRLADNAEVARCVYDFFPKVESRLDATGQLWVRSPMTISPEQWLATGDRVTLYGGHKLGQQDDLQARAPLTASPCFEWLGRIDRLINVSGQKHSPEAAERFLQEVFSHPELALMGMTDPDRGERPMLVYRDDRVWDPPKLAKARRLLAREHPLFPTLAAMVRVPKWPLMPNGKLAHHELKRAALRELENAGDATHEG